MGRPAPKRLEFRIGEIDITITGPVDDAAALYAFVLKVIHHFKARLPEKDEPLHPGLQLPDLGSPQDR